MKNQISLRLKIIILGEGGIGKTTLSKSFEQNTIFKTTSQTIGVEIHIKHLTLDRFPCTIQLWDLGGQEHFKNMGVFQQFCEGSHGAFVCFDLSDLNTFNRIDDWIKFLPSNTPFFILGTKADLENADDMLYRQIKNYISNTTCLGFLETRYDDFVSIEKAFNELISHILEKNKEEVVTFETTRLTNLKISNPASNTEKLMYNKPEKSFSFKNESGSILIR